MKQVLEIMSNFRHASKFYEKQFTRIRENFGMTQLELDILAFLKNNPESDTASDIVRYRMLPKANVSQAVDFLIRKDMLSRRTDERDRRRIHLELSSKSEEILEEILEAQRNFWETLFRGISDEQREQYFGMTYLISENIMAGLESDEDGKS